jgi:FkbM family methyltransferase
MKKMAKWILLKTGLYYRAKYSRLFYIYQWLFKPQEIKNQQKEEAFYKSFLPSCQLIFDIGAYDGHKTAAFLTLSKKVVCCEPDELNFKILQTRFRNKKKRVFIENKALSDKTEKIELHIHHPGSAFNTISRKWVKLLEDDNKIKWDEQIKFTRASLVETTTLDEMINKYGVPDFIKIDAEGSEEAILKGLSKRVAFLSFESLLPDYAAELKNCLDRIDSLDHSATYNIAKDEKFIMPQFINRDQLEKWVNANNNALSFEIVVKMSA